MSQRFLTETVVGTSFSFLTDDEVRKMSVCRITNPVTFDQFNHPTTNGLYDRLMGPTEFNVNCGSCFLNMNECPGHIGHIDLSVPLYNPTLFPLLFRLLRLKCYACHKFRAPQRMSQILKAKLMLLDCGKIVDVLELDDRLRSAGAAAAAAVATSSSSMSSSLSSKKTKTSKKKKSTKKQGKTKAKKRSIDEEDEDEEMDNDGDEEEEEEEEDGRPDPKEMAQSVADAINDEINRYLRDVEIDCIAQCGPDVGCGLRSNVATQYSQHVRECRASLVNDFLKSFPPKCGNCSAVALSLRKDGFSKIFQVPLTPTAAVAMASKGITYKSAAGVLRMRELREKARRNRVDREAKGKEEDDENDADFAALEAEMEEGAADLMSAVVADNDMDEDEEEEEEDEEEGGVSKASKKKGSQAKPNFMPASEVAAQMQLLWEHEAEVVRRVFFPVSNTGDLLRNKVRYNDIRAHVFDSNKKTAAARQTSGGGWRFFFLRVLPVAPPRFRPPTRLGESQFEHPQNVYLTKVLKLNYELVDLGLGGASSSEGSTSLARKSAAGDITGGVDMRKALTVWMNLQNTVNGLIDSGKMQTQSGTEAAPGIKQLLEKKEGMFRKYMMGKRVNFAARTVISPDPFLRVDQVGVPLRFAKGLTFKQPVTAWNSAEMRRLVINGPNVWPGATHVEESSGAIIDLSTKTLQQREAMAKKLLLTSGAASAGFDGSATSGFIPTSGPIISSSTLSTQLLQPIDLDPAQGAAAAASGSLPGVGVTRVWRHLQDNDIVLMNRQVSLLSNPSI